MKSVLIGTLVVEDERTLREGLASAVTAAGHRAFAVEGISDALAILESEVIG